MRDVDEFLGIKTQTIECHEHVGKHRDGVIGHSHGMEIVRIAQKFIRVSVGGA
jgi:hypothetical protein